MKKIYFLLAFMFFTSMLFSQQWVKNLPQNKSKTELSFFDYQKAFYDYWAPYNVDNGYYVENGVKKKAYGWKQFKRWEYEMQYKINPSTGEFPKKTAQEVYEEYLRNNPGVKSPSTANWTSLGPVSSNSGYVNIGRVNCIAYHPTDPNTYWVGAASGGLWVTTNNGSSWTCLTDNNGVLAVSDIVIPSDYVTSNTIYIATGDKDNWANRSIGVLKSTNGGATWNTTGLNYTLSSNKMVERLLMDPNNNQILIAATNNGVYKTTNGGVTWDTFLTSLFFIDMKYKPGDFNTLYGAAMYPSQIYLSTNGGSTWTPVLTNSNFYRIELAVSANQPTWIYAVISDYNTNGLNSIYKSTNSGSSYSLVFDGTISCNNLLGWVPCQTGGQADYDLALAVSPSNANNLVVGGISTWISTNGGISWTEVSSPIVHVDKHMLRYANNGNLFECSDGGVSLSTDNGQNWSNISGGLVISQMYRLGNSATVSNEVITGLQDNGTKLFSGGNWSNIFGGDGMECIIDYTNVNTQYLSYQMGNLYRTLNHWGGGSTFITPSSAGTGAWDTPFIIDPSNNQILYAGYADVWKTTNQGTTWTKISTINASTYKLQSMAIAPSNTQYIYVADFYHIWKTVNGGTSWTEITGNLPLTTNVISYIAVKNDDPSTLWVTLGGSFGYSYNSNNVFQSTNGGTSWTNISTGLPQLPAYAIVQNKQSTTDVQLYVGTELGVYFKEGSDNWISYNTGLPNVKIGEIEIYYAANPQESKLRAATFGRGLWESGLNEVFGVINPTSFAAVPVSTTQINLSWIKNANNNNVMVAWSPTSTFGTPVTGTAYVTGNTIPGGGTVVYTGAATSFNHTSLQPATTYYYKLWSVDSGNNYSTGITQNATTLCGIISSFPWNEGFENGGTIPNCWTQEQVSSSGINWTFITGSGNNHPVAAHGGTYNACLKDGTSADNKTRLITPSINLSSISIPTLKFWHTQAVWPPDQDQMIVYYKTSAGGSWTQLASYTSNITAWTQETISLPNASSDYYINFEGNAKWGYGVCIDDIQITGLPINMQLSNITIPNGTNNCYNASQTITVAGSGTTFTIQNGGSVTLIAGQNILLLPGTLVQSGGYMLAYITTNGLYCGALESAIVSIPPPEEEDQPDPDLTGQSFTIFPNPTTGRFTLLLDAPFGDQTFYLQVTGMLGNQIIRQRLEGSDHFEFDLSGQNPGIYIIRLITGERVETKKLVKN